MKNFSTRQLFAPTPTLTMASEMKDPHNWKHFNAQMLLNVGKGGALTVLRQRHVCVIELSARTRVVHERNAHGTQLRSMWLSSHMENGRATACGCYSNSNLSKARLPGVVRSHRSVSVSCSPMRRLQLKLETENSRGIEVLSSLTRYQDVIGRHCKIDPSCTWDQPACRSFELSYARRVLTVGGALERVHKRLYCGPLGTRLISI